MPTSQSLSFLAVIGRGRVRVSPDRTILTLQLEALTPTVDGTQRSLEASRARVAAALDQAGIGAQHVASSGPQLEPQHEYEKSRWVFKGIHGSEQLVIRVPCEPGRVTAVLRALAEELEHLRIAVSHVARDTTSARADALRAAVADARSQAETIATASGVNLGAICELNRCSDPNASRDGMTAVNSSIAESSPGEGEFDPMEVTIDVEVKAVWTLTPRLEMPAA